MNKLYAKFVKILEICKQFSENLVNESGNVPRRGPVPKFSDLEVVALSLTAETESIDSEKRLFDYKLQEYKDSNPNHSTNLRLTVQIHSTFSRVVHFLYENFFLIKMILCHIGLYKTSLHIFYFYRAFRSSFFQHFSFC